MPINLALSLLASRRASRTAICFGQTGNLSSLGSTKFRIYKGIRRDTWGYFTVKRCLVVGSLQRVVSNCRLCLKDFLSRLSTKHLNKMSIPPETFWTQVTLVNDTCLSERAAPCAFERHKPLDLQCLNCKSKTNSSNLPRRSSSS